MGGWVGLDAMSAAITSLIILFVFPFSTPPPIALDAMSAAFFLMS